jgi:hypothetical protein
MYFVCVDEFILDPLPPPHADMARISAHVPKNKTNRPSPMASLRKTAGNTAKNSAKTASNSVNDRGLTPADLAVAELTVKFTLAVGAPALNETDFILGTHW